MCCYDVLLVLSLICNTERLPFILLYKLQPLPLLPVTLECSIIVYLHAFLFLFVHSFSAISNLCVRIEM